MVNPQNNLYIVVYKLCFLFYLEEVDTLEDVDTEDDDDNELEVDTLNKKNDRLIFYLFIYQRKSFFSFKAIN